MAGNRRQCSAMTFEVRVTDNGYLVFVYEGGNAQNYGSGGIPRVHASERAVVEDIRSILCERLNTPEYQYGEGGDGE